ncbi:MAG: NADAR family protein [Bacteroidetes bacterium]|nr:NADAR family protein [Bacteroidota bacterium]
MNYSIDWLKQQTNLEFLFFWGHQPSRDGSIIKTCMSQWWPSAFNDGENNYLTAEHYMMAQKAKLFGDEEIFSRILTKSSPKDVKDLGRQIRNFDAKKWDANKYAIVKRGNYLKFSQDEQLLNFLKQTKNKILVEASPVDPVWGIGLAEDDPKSLNPLEWQGLNLLGFALMEVRDELNK